MLPVEILGSYFGRVAGSGTLDNCGVGDTRFARVGNVGVVTNAAAIAAPPNGIAMQERTMVGHVLAFSTDVIDLS